VGYVPYASSSMGERSVHGNVLRSISLGAVGARAFLFGRLRGNS
jgi:hypothetical protein